MAICLNRSYDKHRHTEASRGSSRLSLILCRLDMLLDFDSPKHTQSSVSCHDFSPCPEKRLWGIHVPFWMHTCSYPRLAIQPPLRRQAPITILSRLCWFSGSNPCSRCLLSTHLLWQPSDKQRLLKEVFHKQILPAGQWLKRPFLSPSSGTQPIELAPGSPTLRRAMGQSFTPQALGHPHVVPGHLCPPTASVGTLCGEPCYLNQLWAETREQFRHIILNPVFWWNKS